MAGSGDGTLIVWDLEGGMGPLALRGHTQGVTGVAFSPDGNRVFSTSSDGTLRVWETATWQQVLVLRSEGAGGVDGGVGLLAVSPDGRRILNVSANEPPRVWDAGE